MAMAAAAGMVIGKACRMDPVQKLTSLLCSVLGCTLDACWMLQVNKLAGEILERVLPEGVKV